MADRSVLFRVGGAFQDLAQSDVLLSAGVKNAAGSITIDASANVLFNTGGSTRITIQSNGRLDTTASATTPAVRIGSFAGDPSALANGDLWYNSTLNKFRARENGATINISGGVTDHGALTGLVDDDHAQYAILAGRAGSQTLKGGTAASEDLILDSTAHATKGNITALSSLLTLSSAIRAALRIGSFAGDPSTLVDGDVWYNSTLNKFRAKENGASVDIIGGGSSVASADIWRLSMLHGVA